MVKCFHTSYFKHFTAFSGPSGGMIIMGWIHLNREVGIRSSEMLGAVGHACYIHRDEGRDKIHGESFDWTGKTDLYESEMIVGEGAADWVHEYAEGKQYVEFWEHYEDLENTYIDKRYARQDIEAIEDYKANAPIYFRETIALPIELSNEANSVLIKDYIDQAYTQHGITVQLAIHDDLKNPHAHLMGTIRRQVDHGLSARFDDFGRYGDRKRRLREVRALYASIGNQHLKKHGFEPRLDHRSYIDQGLPFEPTVHEGWGSRELQSDGKPSRIGQENIDTAKRNAEIASEMPGAVIAELQRSKATFTEADIKAALFKRVNGDDVLYQMSAQKIMQHEDLVIVGRDLRGQDRYSTNQYVEIEQNALNYANELIQKSDMHSLDIDRLNTRINDNYSFASEEQREALRHIARENDLVFLQGRAGTGKTTMMKILSEEYRAEGFNVKGFALAGAAADNLERETSIPSMTIDRHIYQSKRLKELDEQLSVPLKRDATNQQRYDRDKLHAVRDRIKADITLTSKDILFIDEGGMVGTTHYHHILKEANEAGAKVIAIGDNAQLKAFSAGALYDEMIHQYGAAQLNDIRRQNKDWQKEASVYLSEHETRAALNLYDENGRIKLYKDDEITRSKLITSYVYDLQKYGKQEEQIIIATTREDVANLNKDLRNTLIQTGFVKDQTRVAGKAYGEGDQLVFLSNDNTGYVAKTISGDGKGVKNGTRGTLSKIIRDKTGAKLFEVKLHGSDRIIHFNPAKNQKFFDYGYAVTNHKAQGATVDRSYVMAHETMREDAVYVALTRHREDTHVFASQTRFEDFGQIVEQLARTGSKDVAHEYSEQIASSEEFRILENYQQLRVEASHLLQHISLESIQQDIEVWEHSEWETYSDMRETKMKNAEVIADNWNDYSRLARQIHLTKEKIEVDAGIRERILTNAEKKVIAELKQYVKVATDTRDLWNDIKLTHPGAKSRFHERFEDFEQMRHSRNEMASHYLEDKAKYAPVMRHVNTSWKVIKDHNEQREAFLDRSEEFYGLNESDQRRWGDIVNYSRLNNSTNATFQDLREESKIGIQSLHIKGSLNKKRIHELKGYEDYEKRRNARDKAAFEILNDAKSEKFFGFHKVGAVIDKHASDHAFRLNLEAYKTAKSQVQIEESRRIATKLKHDVEPSSTGKMNNQRYYEVEQSGIQYKAVKTDARLYVNAQALKQRQSKLEGRDLTAFNLMNEYKEVRKASGLTYSVVKSHADEMGVHFNKSELYPDYERIINKRNEVAFKIVKAEAEKFAQEHKVNLPALRKEATIHEMKISIHAYRVHSQKNNLSKRDAMAYHIQAIRTKTDSKTNARFGAMLRQDKIDNTALKANADAHKLRLSLERAEQVKLRKAPLNKVKKPTAQFSKKMQDKAKDQKSKSLPNKPGPQVSK